MFRKIAISTLGAAMLLTTSVPALAMPRGNGLPIVKTESVQLIRDRGVRGNRNGYYRRGNYGRRGYGRGYYGGYYGGYNDGAALVLGIIGLGTGLAIANSYRGNAYYGDRYDGYQSGSPEWIAACARKYRSFEPRTGLYTAYSGYKRRCRLP
jgi:hypothetical protein